LEKEKLSEQWKESIIEAIYKERDKQIVVIAEARH
jgi:hypothetical protein